MNAVEVKSLTYKFEGNKIALTDINIVIPWNTRTLLVGCNGAGKSTLLKLISGKHLCLDGSIKVNGIDPFAPVQRDEDDCINTTYLGTEWCHMNIIERDIGVLELFNSIGFQFYKERGDKLVNMLDVNLEWRMHRLSDGQKRRVQLVMGLLKPWRVLLLDEVTVDLDVIARSRLLQFLKEETQTRKCSIIYATHIFDGLSEWPDYVKHIHDGKIVKELVYSTDVKFVDSKDDKAADGHVKVENNTTIVTKTASLHPLAVSWLLDDLNKH